MKVKFRSTSRVKVQVVLRATDRFRRTTAPRTGDAGGRDELDLFLITEHGRSDRAADRHVETVPAAGIVGGAEAHETGHYAAFQLIAALHLGERLRRGPRRAERQHRRGRK
jgi:hypothetical protein